MKHGITLGTINLALGEYHDAITCYDKALKIKPRDKITQENRKYTLTKLEENKIQGQLESLIANMKRELEIV